MPKPPAILSADYIKCRRENLGLAQRDLAEILGVNGSMVADWERGMEPSAALNKLLRLYFDCPEARRFLDASWDEDRAPIGHAFNPSPGQA
jgi:DNA-binding transcriptional regulator YiaG